MVRSAHRTCLAKFVALCLLAFAVSPVTAPFTTCDLTDFAQSHAADSPGHHPGRQLAEAHVKIAPHLVTIAFQLAPRLPLRVDGPAQSVFQAERETHTRNDLHTVLRL